MSRQWDLTCRPPAGLRHPVPIDPAGRSGPTPGASRGPKWRATSRGLYVPADTPTDVPEQRVVEQAARLPADGAVTGWAACRLHGANFLDGRSPVTLAHLPVPLALGEQGNIRAEPGAVLTRERLRAEEVTRIAGVPVVTAERAVFDAVRQCAGDREAVAVLDTCVAAGLTSLERMTAYVAQHPGWKRVGRARFAVRHGREHVRSPAETSVRLLAELDAGLPRLHVNCPVHDQNGRLLGVADLLDEEAGLVIEFDGADHRTRRQHTRDTERDEDMRGVGLEVTRVTGTDLRNPAAVVSRIRQARERARFLPPDARAWEARPTPDCAEQDLREREVVAEIVRESAQIG